MKYYLKAKEMQTRIILKKLDNYEPIQDVYLYFFDNWKGFALRKQTRLLQRIKFPLKMLLSARRNQRKQKLESNSSTLLIRMLSLD